MRTPKPRPVDYLPDPDGMPCDDWRGRPSEHQAQARSIIGITPPFTWIATTCASKICLEPEHLVVRQPLKLGYRPGICIYCGHGATTRDHLIPETWSGPAIRHQVLTVPACQNCNSSIGDTLTFSITARRRLAHERIERHGRKWLRCQNFTPGEIRELGHGLRSYVKEGMQMRALIESRLNWPPHPLYDLTACTDAGIENPYEIGMLDDPDAIEGAA